MWPISPNLITKNCWSLWHVDCAQKSVDTLTTSAIPPRRTALMLAVLADGGCSPRCRCVHELLHRTPSSFPNRSARLRRQRESQDSRGMTALDLALREGRLECARQLLAVADGDEAAATEALRKIESRVYGVTARVRDALTAWRGADGPQRALTRLVCTIEGAPDDRQRIEACLREVANEPCTPRMPTTRGP